VNCIYEGTDQLYIHPTECIDCGACEPECPVTAIFEESNVPAQWAAYTRKNAQFFDENPDVKPAQGRAEMGAGGLGKTAVAWPPP
jgi:ferredoxin